MAQEQVGGMLGPVRVMWNRLGVLLGGVFGLVRVMWNRLGMGGQVLLGGVLGLCVGLIMREAGSESGGVDSRLVGLFGELWIRGLKLAVLPLIFCSMLTTTNSMKSIKGSESIGKMAILYYTVTTICAVVIGCLVCLILVVPFVEFMDSNVVDEKADLVEMDVMDQIENILFGFVQPNIVKAAADSELMGIILFGIIVGAALDEGSPVAAFCGELNKAMFKLISFLINFTPLAVASLIAPNVAALDGEIVGRNLGFLTAACVTAFLVQVLIVYPLIYFIVVRENPFRFYKKIFPAMLTALGTASSAATLPVTMTCVLDAGVNPDVAKFVTSLGATINMDGTAMYFPICVIWMACTAGVSLGFGDMISICIVSTLASMGAAPVPSAGLVLIILIMDTVSVPQTAAFALIYAMDWVYDRMQTAVNVCGDAIGTAVVQAKVPPAVLAEVTQKTSIISDCKSVDASVPENPAVQQPEKAPVEQVTPVHVEADNAAL